MKTKRKKNKKAGMIKNLSSRQLTGKTTPTMVDDSWALEELREQQQKRNNIALNLIKFHKDETDNGNTDDLNNIKVAITHLFSNSLNNDLILEKDKQDLRDFRKKLMKKRIELDNKKQRTARGKKRKRRKTRSRYK
tara:strand:+ start:428 stop:835 length:408 start_codon:yes stop_codon:yes gene_type:complete